MQTRSGDIYQNERERERERERDLLSVIVAPFNSKLKRGALGVVSNGPVVLQWHHVSDEEIIVTRPYKHGHRVTSQNVFLTYRPCPSFYVYLISKATSIN
jgi:hypothetical protein